MVDEAQSSERKLILILAVGALLFALIVVAVVLVLVLGGKGEPGEGVTANAAELMPADTVMFFSMNPDFTAADNFDVVRKAWGDIPGFAKVVDNWPGVLFEDVEELDYQADIEPWLGDELSFSIGPNFFTALGAQVDQVFQNIEESLGGGYGQSPSVGAMPEVPQFIMTVATKDTAASDKFLDKLRAEAEQDGTTMKETEYEGVKVVYQEPESEGDVGMAYATVDNFIVLTAGGLEQMQAIIDGRDGESLADSEAYKKTVAALPEGSVGFAYMDMGAMMETWLTSFEEMSGALGMGGLATLGVDPEQFEALHGAGFSFGFDPQGIRFDFVATYDKGALPEGLSATASPNKAIEHVPSNTLLYFSGANLGGVIKSFMDIAMAQPGMGMEDVEESLQMMESQLGLKLDDLYEALSGEYSLAVTHDVAGIMGDPSVPVGALIQIENKKEETFKQLMSIAGLALMGSEAGMLDTVEIGGVSVTLVNGPTGEPMVGWGLSDDFFALGTSRGLLETAFDGGDKLADDATFKAAIAPLPTKNTGYFYVNVAGGMDLLYQAMSPWEQESFDREGRAILAPIKAIGGASEPMGREKDSASGTLFVLMEGE